MNNIDQNILFPRGVFKFSRNSDIVGLKMRNLPQESDAYQGKLQSLEITTCNITHVVIYLRSETCDIKKFCHLLPVACCLLPVACCLLPVACKNSRREFLSFEHSFFVNRNCLAVFKNSFNNFIFRIYQIPMYGRGIKTEFFFYFLIHF